MSDLFFDADSTTPPPRPSRASRWLTIVGIIVALLLVLAAGGAFWVKGKVDPAGGPGEEIAVDIPMGSSTVAIAELLAEKGVISDATVFRYYLKVKGGGPFEAGLYRMRKNSSMGDVVTVLDDGPQLPPAVNLTIPEGLVLEQVIERIGRVEFLQKDEFRTALESGQVRSKYQPEGKPLEGLLFPDTYRIEERETEVDVLRRMVGTLDDVASSLGYDDAEAKVGYSPYEVLIVASLIEAEAKDDEDRAKIARVVYNRLDEGIPLGIDATFYFALPLDRRGTGLRKSDLERPGPYNTRLNTGLVPTPVALPGRASLEAALNPEPGPWLYYVLKDQRTHAFSESYDEFLRNTRTAQEKGLIP